MNYLNTKSWNIPSVRPKLLISLLIIFLCGYITNCERPTSPTRDNSPPNTTLANIPVENDILFALLTLHWDGEDADGFIAGYQYRYITYHLYPYDSGGQCPEDSVIKVMEIVDKDTLFSDWCIKDSVVQEWTDTDQSSLTIAFESSDSLNYQIFQVRAVDNFGDTDPTPAEKVFFTFKTIPPETEILTPGINKDFFAIDQITDWWQGIQLVFTARDEDGEVVEYAWRVDNGEWNWTSDTTIFITPNYFNPLEGQHTIGVTSRDNTNILDMTEDTVSVNLFKPVFDKRILIVDETQENNFPPPMDFSDADVDNFYSEIFEPDSVWDFNINGMPPKDILGQYQLIIWHADSYFTNESNVHQLPQHIDEITDYLNVGGDLIMVGWRILKSFAVDEAFPKTFSEGSFIHDYLHIEQADESAPIPDFTSAEGYGQFSNIRVDSIKLSESFITSNPIIGLLYVNVIPQYGGFTDVIYRYKNDDVIGIPTFRGYPCGLRYYGTSFNTIVLGFPMFFINEEDAYNMGAEMLQSLGY